MPDVVVVVRVVCQDPVDLGLVDPRVGQRIVRSLGVQTKRGGARYAAQTALADPHNRHCVANVHNARSY